jgi:hypothetical protein
MKKFTILVVCCALAVAGCGDRTATGTLQTLDLESAIDNPRNFDLSEIAQSVEFIPLDESVPVGEIDILTGLTPSENGFYILASEGASPVWHFDRTGKFTSTVGRIGRGPGETPFITGIAANDHVDEVYINGIMDIVGLDAEGKEFARMKPGIIWGMVWYEDRLLTLPVPSLFDENAYTGNSLSLVEMFDRDLKSLGSISGPNLGPFLGMSTGSVGEDYIAATSPPIMSDNGQRLLIKQGRGDTLYNYKAETIVPAYLLDLGNYTPPSELFGLDPSMQWSDRNFIVDNVWEGERYFIVSATNLRQVQQPRRLVFDRRKIGNGGFFATGGIENKPGLFIGGVVFSPCYIRDNQLVGYMQPLDIVDNLERITDPKLKEIANSVEEDSNPIIVVAELKK